MLLLLGSATFAQTPSAPEPPAIWREVTALKYTNPLHNNGKFRGAVHTQPHVPTLRTSRDGRIALRPLGDGGAFTLLKPEKLTSHPLLTAPDDTNPDNNSYVMSEPGWTLVDGFSEVDQELAFFTPASGDTAPVWGHMTLYDPTPADPSPGETTNPRNINGQDVYDLKVVGGYNLRNNGGIQFFVTPVTVRVSNPKTAAATISSITAGTPVGGPVIPVAGASCLEINISADGRLLVLRIAGKNFAWTDQTTNQPQPSQAYNIVYCYYSGGTPADPTQWSSFLPITHAPFDKRINGKGPTGFGYGFALAPFRDAAGNTIPNGEDLGATYPWIDPDAKNLFFTAVSDTLKFASAVGQARYPYVASPGQRPEVAYQDEGSDTRGTSFMGLWSHGKMVLIDNLNNNIDYALGGGENGQGLFRRDVKLFDRGTSPVPTPEWLTLGGGRFNHVFDMAPGENRNSAFMDSIRNVFNYRKLAKPLAIHDVVWQMQNPRQTDEIVFDDYVDHDAFIVANMAGLTTFDADALTRTGTNTFDHYSGWSNTTDSFSNPVFLQNAATPTRDRWIVPAWGAVVGTGGRLEPAATGGIHGKGFWMNGNTGLEFTVVAQPQNVATRDWYACLFMDFRFSNDGNPRLLLSFPDGSKILLFDRAKLHYVNAANQLVREVTLPASDPSNYFANILPDPGWAHLAWEIRKGGREIDFLLNGMLYDRTALPTAMFQMVPGKMIVGKNPAAANLGFRGWIDDFKVLAHAVDPETACNHAGGTLVGFTLGYTGYLKDFPRRFPNNASLAVNEINKRLVNSGEKTYYSYANYYNYTQDRGARLDNIPTGVTSLRQAIHFPEGPLFHDRPRPDSTRNSFCITCHIPQGAPGLDSMALEINPSVNAANDVRRQPSQPFRRLFGNIPASLVDNRFNSSGTAIGATPSSLQVLPAAGKLVDEWMQPQFTGVLVKSFTLVDAGTGADLLELKTSSQTTVARANYPNTTSFAVRANLDFAQGSVSLNYDNGASVTTSDMLNALPYSIVLPSMEVGNHSIVADPELGPPLTITFNVIDPAFAVWRQRNFGGAANDPAIGGLLADPDGDGIANVLEFALSGDPNSGTSKGRTFAKMQSGGGSDAFTYTIAVRVGATFASAGNRMKATTDNLTYTIEGAADLATWGAALVTEISPAITAGLPALDAGWTYHTFRIASGPGAASRCFFRTIVETP